MLLFLCSKGKLPRAREIRSSVEPPRTGRHRRVVERNMLVVSFRKSGKKGKTSGGSVALADLVIFHRQLATMILMPASHGPILTALADQTPNKVMRDVIRDVCARVRRRGQFFLRLCKSIPRFSPGFLFAWCLPVKKAFVGGDPGPARHLPGKMRAPALRRSSPP